MGEPCTRARPGCWQPLLAQVQSGLACRTQASYLGYRTVSALLLGLPGTPCPMTSPKAATASTPRHSPTSTTPVTASHAPSGQDGFSPATPLNQLLLLFPDSAKLGPAGELRSQTPHSSSLPLPQKSQSQHSAEASPRCVLPPLCPLSVAHYLAFTSPRSGGYQFLCPFSFHNVTWHLRP